jgi:hypothetical protein
MPEAYGADGSMTATSIRSRNPLSCNANQPFTQAPERPGTRPSNRPGTAGSALTNDVIQGSERLHPASSRNQRTDRARVSSIPSTRVGSGAGSHPAACAIRARWAVSQDRPCSRAMSDTGRFDRAIEAATRSRSRAMARDLAGICRVAAVNERRGHAGSVHSSRRCRHHSSTRRPDAGRSLTRRSGRSFTHPDSTPHAGHAASRAAGSITTRTSCGPTSCTSSTTWSSRPNSSDVMSDMLVASPLAVVRDLQHVEATSPHCLTTPR